MKNKTEYLHDFISSGVLVHALAMDMLLKAMDEYAKDYCEFVNIIKNTPDSETDYFGNLIQEENSETDYFGNLTKEEYEN